PDPRPFLEGLKALCCQVTIGGARQSQDRLARIDVTDQGWAAICWPPADGTVLVPQVLDLLAQLEGHPFGGRAEGVHERSERAHLRVDRAVVAFHDHEPGHGHPGDRLTLPRL